MEAAHSGDPGPLMLQRELTDVSRFELPLGDLHAPEPEQEEFMDSMSMGNPDSGVNSAATLQVADWCLMQICGMESTLLGLQGVYAERRVGELRFSAVSSSCGSVVSEMRNEMMDGDAGVVSEPDMSFVLHSKGLPKTQCVKKRYVKKFLESELREASACLTISFQVVLLASFCVATIGNHGHFAMDITHSQDASVLYDIVENANFAYMGVQPFENGREGGKTIYDVNSIADFWSWLNLGLLPIVFPDSAGVSEVPSTVAAACESFHSSLQAAGWPAAALEDTGSIRNLNGGLLKSTGGACPAGPRPVLPADAYGADDEVYDFYGKIVGGLRLRQHRSRVRQCSQDADKYKGRLYNGVCLELTKHELLPEVSRAFFMGDDKVDQESFPDVYFKSGVTTEDVRRSTRALEDNVWFSPYTSTIEIMYTSINPSTGIFTAVFIFFFLNRSGHIFKLIEPITLAVDPYASGQLYVADVIWCLCILKMFVEEVWEVIVLLRKHGMKRGTSAYLTYDVLVEWVNVGYAIVIMAMWAAYLDNARLLREMLGEADLALSGSFKSEEELAAFFEHVAENANHVLLMRRILAFYPFILVSGFLKPFSQQPRLGIMVHTLTHAAVDIFHFGVVFLLVFFTYSLMGMLVFGARLEEFANFGRSLVSTFQCLIGEFVAQQRLPNGDVRMSITGRVESFVWLASLCWVLSLVMLNMLIAIVLDVYLHVYSTVPTDAETIWSQAREIVVRWWLLYRKQIVRLSRILDALHMSDQDDEARLSLETFIIQVEQHGVIIPRDQAYHILLAASLLSELDHAGDVSGVVGSGVSKRVRILEQDVLEIEELMKANHAVLLTRIPLEMSDSSAADDEPPVLASMSADTPPRPGA